MSKAKRNDPCQCGSGKKYKKCCWNKDNRKDFTATLISDYTNPESKKTQQLVNSVSQMLSGLEHLDKSVNQIEEEAAAFAQATPTKNLAEPMSLKDKILQGKRPVSEPVEKPSIDWKDEYSKE